MSASRLMLVFGLVVAGCGGGDSTTTGLTEVDEGVAEEVISHESTQEISVWAPVEEGSWPVVFMLHGLGGDRHGLASTAAALARAGHVVFVPDVRTTGDPATMEHDSECAYRYMMSVAAEHGGDLDQPLTAVGHSLGGSTVLVGSLNEAAYGPGGSYDECLTGEPRPDVVVSLAGCHYEYQGAQFGFDPSTYGWGNEDAELTLIVGGSDETCAPWQSRDATAALRAAGYDVTYVEIEGGTHATVIFLEEVADGGEWIPAPDAPAGTATVEAILAAIARAGGGNT